MKKLVTFPALIIGKAARMRNTKQILAGVSMEHEFPEVDVEDAPHVMDVRSLDDKRTLPYRFWQGALMRPLFDDAPVNAFDFSIGDGALRTSSPVFGKVLVEIAQRVADLSEDMTFPKKLDAEIYSTGRFYNDDGKRWTKPHFHDACVEVASKIAMDDVAQEHLEYWRGRAVAALENLAIIDGRVWHVVPEPYWAAGNDGTVTLTGDHDLSKGAHEWKDMHSRCFPIDQLDEAITESRRHGKEARVYGGATIHSLEFRSFDAAATDLARFSRCAVEEFRKWIRGENHATSNPMFIRDMPKAVARAWAELAADTEARDDMFSVDDALADKLATFCETLERNQDWAEKFFRHKVRPETIREVLDAWAAREVGFEMGSHFEFVRSG